ncbi:MAG: GntR family transcriptional regulator [Oscillospiraceae bacterium]|nr:GntR family transcriptional regulator [Oscillospiraceae bacterium]
MDSKQKLSDIAHAQLKGMILNNQFRPGEHLEETVLCDMLSVSRTPLREAINRLVNENLLIAVPQKGIFVPEMSVQNIADLFRARKLIEPMVIMLSAPNLDHAVLIEFKEKTEKMIVDQDISALHSLDYDFHSYINNNCGNQYIFQSVSFITDQFQRVRTQNFFPVERSINGAKEHLVIIDTILKAEYSALPDLMLNHITSTETYYFRKLLENSVAESNIEYLKRNPILTGSRQV